MQFYLIPPINPKFNFIFTTKAGDENTRFNNRAVLTHLWQHTDWGGFTCHSRQGSFLYLPNLLGGTQLPSRIIFYFQVAKLSPNKLRYFTAIYSTYQAASNFNPKSSSPFMTPTAFRYSISGCKTLMKQHLWIKSTGLFPAVEHELSQFCPAVRKGSPPVCSWKTWITEPRTPDLHKCIPASDTHPAIQSEMQLCLISWNPQHSPAAPLRCQVLHSTAGNKCQQQLRLCFGGWSDNVWLPQKFHIFLSCFHTTSLSQQISQKENKVWTDLFAKLSIHNLFHTPNPCSENITFVSESEIYARTWTNAKHL